MSRSAPTPSATNAGAKTFVSFLLGVGLGLALVSPVVPEVIEPLLADPASGTNSVLLLGVLALTILVGVLVVAFQALFSDR